MNTTNPYAPPQATVQDVKDPSASNELAGRGTRLVAAILDGVIFSAAVYLPLFIAIKANGHPLFLTHGNRPPTFNFGAVFAGIGAVLPLAGLIVWIWVTILFVARNGQSIAKKLMGIKVVRSDGSKASLARIFFLRNVVNTLLAFIPLYGLIDVLLIFGESRQCIHDKIADTVVVDA